MRSLLHRIARKFRPVVDHLATEDRYFVEIEGELLIVAAKDVALSLEGAAYFVPAKGKWPADREAL